MRIAKQAGRLLFLSLTPLALVGAKAPDRQKLKLDYLEMSAPVGLPRPSAAGTDPSTIETESGGRLGIALVDAQGHLLLGFNRDERFAMCSTFKAPLAAAVLESADKGRFGLDGTLPITKAELLDNSPVTKANLKRGRLAIADLAKAAVTVSDNSAANILLPLVGGPDGLTSFVRAHGDAVTRFDRTEPDLNENAQGDPRDTTSPAAMATLMARLLLHDLQATPAARLRGWLENSTTGLKRIRAGLPTGWSAGDKTGSCGTAFNDVAILRSPGGGDYVLAIYLDRPTVSAADAEKAIAQATKATLAMLTSVAREKAAPAGPPASRPPSGR